MYHHPRLLRIGRKLWLRFCWILRLRAEFRDPCTQTAAEVPIWSCWSVRSHYRGAWLWVQHWEVRSLVPTVPLLRMSSPPMIQFYNKYTHWPRFSVFCPLQTSASQSFIIAKTFCRLDIGSNNCVLFHCLWKYQG